MSDKFETKFEQDGLNKEIKRMKRKSLIKNSIISLVVTIVVIAIALTLNTRINIKEMEKDFKRQESITALTVPNGYILEASYDFEILGGKGQYKIAREIGGKSVILKDYIKQYGSINVIKSATYGSGIRFDRNSDKAPPEFWESGYRKMMFYHPDIDYKSYKNDFQILDEIPEGKIIEMGISLDKAYTISEINNIFKDTKASWIGLDMFTDKFMEDKKDEAENFDSTASFIIENDIIGISMYNITGESIIATKVSEVIDLLKASPINEHNEIYSKYYNKNDEYTARIIAITVHGTKDELVKLRYNKHIKASSIGVVEDLY